MRQLLDGFKEPISQAVRKKRNIGMDEVLSSLNLEAFQQKYCEATLVTAPGIEEHLDSLIR